MLVVSVAFAVGEHGRAACRVVSSHLLSSRWLLIATADDSAFIACRNNLLNILVTTTMSAVGFLVLWHASAFVHGGLVGRRRHGAVVLVQRLLAMLLLLSGAFLERRARRLLTVAQG